MNRYHLALIPVLLLPLLAHRPKTVTHHPSVPVDTLPGMLVDTLPPGMTDTLHRPLYQEKPIVRPINHPTL